VSRTARLHLSSLPRARQNDALATGSTVQRTYLFVPPEEESRSRLWRVLDADSKRGTSTRASLPLNTEWLPATEHEEEFTITSTERYVAAATTACSDAFWSSRSSASHCESGTVCGEPLDRFYRLGCWAINDSSRGSLADGLITRKVITQNAADATSRITCPNCGQRRTTLPSLRARRTLFRYSERGAGFPSNSRRSPDDPVGGDEHFQVD